MSRKPPEKLVVMGRVVAPFGIKGWIKVEAFTATTGALSGYPTWWLGRDGAWRERAVTEARARGPLILAKLEGCDSRDDAAMLGNQRVAVPREALPKAGDGEFYWADLIGLKVVNRLAQNFGPVVRILETGANDVLVVQGERERLIPFIAEVVREVDLSGGVIKVDWDADY